MNLIQQKAKAKVKIVTKEELQKIIGSENKKNSELKAKTSKKTKAKKTSKK
jgi:hypothetical protein